MKKRDVFISIIQNKIHVIRGQRVMLDFDLARLYQVTTGNLNLAVKRNIKRFPSDFMFRLTELEMKALILQSAISNTRGGRRKPVTVFTEQGVAMLSSVLRSERAIHVNVAIMRAFVELREKLSLRKEFASELEKIERRLEGHDIHIHEIFQIIRDLMNPPLRSKRRIGFV